MTYSLADRTRMILLYRDGLSLNRIAQVFTCSPTTVLRHLKLAEIARRPSGGLGGPRDPRRPHRSGVRRTKSGYSVRWFSWFDESGTRRTTEIAEHRIVMAKALGRALDSHEQVHHKNGRRDDNRLENLELRLGNHGSGATHCPHCGMSLSVLTSPELEPQTGEPLPVSSCAAAAGDTTSRSDNSGLA